MNVAVLNFYMSALRNMFLTSSIAIAMVGFSEKFSNMRRLLISKIAFGVVALSIGFGLKSTQDFNLLLKKELSKKDLTEIDKEILHQAKQWPLMAYCYIGFLGIIAISLIIRFINQKRK
tara:strand:+ start:1288 stop:1644 length:357 start_codon:yes stop_codon:yes gene_type:complete